MSNVASVKRKDVMFIQQLITFYHHLDQHNHLKFRSIQTHFGLTATKPQSLFKFIENW